MSRLEGLDGLQFNALSSLFDQPGGTVDFVGGGTLQGYGDGDGNAVGPWQIGSDADIAFRPVDADIDIVKRAVDPETGEPTDETITC